MKLTLADVITKNVIFCHFLINTSKLIRNKYQQCFKKNSKLSRFTVLERVQVPGKAEFSSQSSFKQLQLVYLSILSTYSILTIIGQCIYLKNLNRFDEPPKTGYETLNNFKFFKQLRRSLPTSLQLEPPDKESGSTTFARFNYFLKSLKSSPCSAFVSLSIYLSIMLL